MAHQPIRRREFLGSSATAAAALTFAKKTEAGQSSDSQQAIVPPDSLVHSHEWESLNPGYWQVKDGVLRRRLINVGDRARSTGFPFHSATKGGVMQTMYDPSLPDGIIYRRDWKLAGEYTVKAVLTYRSPRSAVADGDDPNWRMYQNGYGRMGIAIGAKSLLESYGRISNAVRIVWCDDNTLQIVPPGRGRRNQQGSGRNIAAKIDTNWQLEPGDQVTLTVDVQPASDGQAEVSVTLAASGSAARIRQTIPQRLVNGYVGVAARGLIDFEVAGFDVQPGTNKPLSAAKLDCYVCYPLGDTLNLVDGRWQCRFVGLFASDGDTAEVRIADSPNPAGGWQKVPIAGRGRIVNHEWRRNTAVINATLPSNPAQQNLYYTVWQDGVDVTSDTRIGTDACGPGTGLVGDVPASGSYVGRLPQLRAPYKLCGLSCHAITSGLQQQTEDGWKILGGGDDWQVRDQPTTGAYKHLEDYDFQVMVWEDDVWYMELVLYPPSTDDAYKIITQSICGPTSRWQMMRHWNVINPGDHDYGMDDVKGPEQLAIRRVQGLGQDVEYMRRNFQIVHHLTTGAETVDPLANPKKWRAWKMPNRDFTFVILDSRLWRSSQDTDMWDDAGWGSFQNLYDRTDPTRSLLGEEQFAWLQALVTTDSSRLICLTGINGMHTVWTGTNWKGGAASHIKGPFDQRDRVTADYAGWVKAGADRVLELLGSRDGIITVYGDVHNGCLMKNADHGVIECSFGPIGRSGGRAVIPGFGPQMKDFDGRDLEVHALYHKTHADAELNGHAAGDPFYWNFLEMEFDPRPADPVIDLRVRNMIDAPRDAARGGGSLNTVASQTGRRPSSQLPPVNMLPNADIRFTLADGSPIRGTRSDNAGAVQVAGLVDVERGTRVIMTAFDGARSASIVVDTV
ncbi:MAG: alkaline phosphatase D family protein [Fuerstiella sp.]|nr:alkaline phosphatase D family protein [Fuerstiella sp.]